MSRALAVAVAALLPVLLAACPAKEPVPQARKAAKKAAPRDPRGEGHFVFEKGRLPRSVPRALTPAERRPWDRAVADPKNRGKLHTLFRPAISSAAFIKTIGIQPGDVVADIGCGTGALQIGILEHGVPFKKLYAVDQQEGALALLDQTLEATRYPGWKKVQTLRPGRDDTHLPRGSLHRALIVNVMQFIFDPRSHGIKKERDSILRFLTSLKKALRPGGLVYNYKELGSGEGGDRKRPAPGKAQIKHWFKRIAYPLEATGYRVVRSETHDIEGVKYLLVVAGVTSE